MRMVSPTPSASSVPRPTADFSEPDHFVPASVIPRCSGLSICLGEQAVRRDRVGHVRRLDRDLEVLEAETVHELHVLEGGTHERLDGVLALELVQVPWQRAGVHADPHRHARSARLVHHLPDLVVPADIARVDPDAVCAGVDRLEGERVVEVDVGDHRDRRLHDDPLERPDVLVARDRAAHQIPTRLGDGVDLLHGRVEVRGLGLRHRLDRDGRPAADLHPANVDLLSRGHLRPPSLARRRAPRSRPSTSRGSACASASWSA